MIFLETERLLFRTHEARDEADFVRMHTDREVRRYMGGLGMAGWPLEKALDRFRSQWGICFSVKANPTALQIMDSRTIGAQSSHLVGLVIENSYSKEWTEKDGPSKAFVTTGEGAFLSWSSSA